MAFTSGAHAVEAYPVDSRGDRIDRTLAYAGLLHWFTDAGFIASPRPRCTCRATTGSWSARNSGPPRTPEPRR